MLPPRRRASRPEPAGRSGARVEWTSSRRRRHSQWLLPCVLLLVGALLLASMSLLSSAIHPVRVVETEVPTPPATEESAPPATEARTEAPRSRKIHPFARAAMNLPGVGSQKAPGGRMAESTDEMGDQKCSDDPLTDCDEATHCARGSALRRLCQRTCGVCAVEEQRLIAARRQTDEVAAAAHDAPQTCLSFLRTPCPPFNFSEQSATDQRQTHQQCTRYVSLERNLSSSARFCGGRLPRANPCWSEGGKTRCLPAFFILGEMKCGTTTLYALLDKHPSVVPPLTKEPRFFQQGRFGHTSLSRYVANFKPVERSADANALTFDASPVHLRSPIARFWLAKWLPDARLIVLVRNPIQRAYSHWKMGSEWIESKCAEGSDLHKKMSGYLDLFTFDKMMERSVLLATHNRCALEAQSKLRQRTCHEPIKLGDSASEVLNSTAGKCMAAADAELVHRYMDEFTGAWPTEADGGKSAFKGAMRAIAQCSENMLTPPGPLMKGATYASEIQAWLDIFPRSALKVIHTDDLYSHAQRVMNETFTFLGLDPVNVGTKTRFCVHGKAGVIDVLHSSEKALHLGSQGDQEAERDRESPTLQIGDCESDATSRPDAATGAPHHAIEPGLEARLRKFYAPSNRRLYKLLGRDLGW